nr:MAG TPA: hypothetical protein [Caudoviricetes sp.]
MNFRGNLKDIEDFNQRTKQGHQRTKRIFCDGEH